MTITLLHNSPLFLAAHGARTCWDSHDKSDTTHEKVHTYQANSPEGSCGAKDAELVCRVGNKFKHSSILEHLQVVAQIDNSVIADTLAKDKFFTVTSENSLSWVISFNVRSLQNANLPVEVKLQLIPPEYTYLFK